MSDVGAELRRMRESTGMSASAVAREVGWSQSKISRVETGRFGASASEVAQLLTYYGVAEEVRAEILGSVARSTGLEGAWVVSAGGPARRQAAVESVEARVRRLRQYQCSWIPGLLQTEAYATGLCDAAGYDPATVVPSRMARQTILAERGDGVYEVIVDEAVLRRSPRVASTDMEAQMTRLIEHLDSGYADLRVIPLGSSARSYVAGSFVVYDFTTSSPVVLCETQTADLYLSAEQDVSAYEKVLARLLADAFDEKGTRGVIEDARRSWAS